jgi:outer membrane autotransporter protein
VVLCLCLGLAALPADSAAAPVDINTPVTGNVFGNDDTGTQNNNTVNINTGGSVSVYADGGNPAGTGGVMTNDVSDNTVNINTDGNVGTARGGIAGFSGGVGGGAFNNEVNLINGSVGDVVGGHATVGDATGNKVTISGGSVNGGVMYHGVIGGSSTNGDVTNNTVTISGGTIGTDVYGGRSVSGNATGNTVTISGGTVGGTISGGESASGDAFTGNTLNLSNNTALSKVQNFNTINFLTAGSANIGTLDTSYGTSAVTAVTLNSNANAIDFGGSITGTGGIDKQGAGTLTLSGVNTYSGGTTVSGGTLAGNIAANTDLTVAGGATYNGFGADRYVNVLSGAGNIINSDSLTVQSGAFSGDISGAGVLFKTGAGDLTLSGANTYGGWTEIRDGRLILDTGGEISSSFGLGLYGGTTFDYSLAAAYNAASPGLLQNVDVIGLGATIKPNASYAAGADFSGSELYFVIPSGAVAGDRLLIVDGKATIDGTTDVHLFYETVRPNISPGQQLTLLDVTSLDSAGFVTMTVQTPSGDEYSVEVNGDQLWAVLTYISPTGPAYERLKAYAESRVANLAFVNQGLDFLLNHGFGSAIAMTKGEGFRYGAFGGMGGTRSRYNSGSHVDVYGMSILAGFAFGNDMGRNRLTLGTFFEGGWGNYNSHNSFSNHASVKGKGDTDYYGAGLLGRYDVKGGVLTGLYVDTSARFGWTSADFRTKDIQYSGNRASFDSSSLYYGLHGGVGYVLGFGDKASLDFSGKLLWTHQEGDSVRVDVDRVRFNDGDSLRSRLGGRFAWALNAYLTPYAGAYWEHEFDGRSKASVNGISVGTPHLRGDTGMGEVGFSLNPSKNLPLYFDVAVQGYIGKREGVTGSLHGKYEF